MRQLLIAHLEVNLSGRGFVVKVRTLSEGSGQDKLPFAFEPECQTAQKMCGDLAFVKLNQLPWGF